MIDYIYPTTRNVRKLIEDTPSKKGLGLDLVDTALLTRPNTHRAQTQASQRVATNECQALHVSFWVKLVH